MPRSPYFAAVATVLLPLLTGALGCQPDEEGEGDDDTFVPDTGDTTPPSLSHEPVVSGAEGVAVVIAAQAADDSGISRVGLSYRRTGEESFTTTLLDDTGGGTFTGEIPADKVTPWGVEYYLTAADTASNQAYAPEGAPSSFVAVEVTPNPPDIAYNLEAQWNPVQGGAVVGWYHVAEEDFLSYTIYRGEDEGVDGSSTVAGEVTDGTIQEFVDPDAPTDLYSWYRVQVTDIWGGTAWSDVAMIHGLYLHQDSWSGFSQPSGILVTGDGSVHVTDREGGTVQHFDAAGSSNAIADEGLMAPIGIAQGLDTGFYVPDFEGDGITVLGGTGDFGSFIDEAAMTPGSWEDPLDLSGPTHIAFNVQFQPCIADSGGGRLIRFTDDFVVYSEATNADSAPLEEPWGVAFHPEGHLLVSDTARGIVAVYGDTNLLPEEGTMGGMGSGDGQLLEPRGVAVDQFGTVLVADQGNGRVALFTLEGQWIGSFGEGILISPTAVAVGGDGMVYVADGGAGSIEVFAP